MTQQEKIRRAEESYKLVKISIQKQEAGMKDKDDHIQLLELTIGRLMWLVKEPTYIEVSKETEEPEMKLVGVINTPWGLKDMIRCEIGHPVYEKGGRYWLVMDSKDGKIEGRSVPFNREEISKIMDKI